MSSDERYAVGYPAQTDGLGTTSVSIVDLTDGRELGRFADGAGTNVEYTKASILGQLAILTAQIVMLLPWVSFPPTSAWASGWAPPSC